MARQARIEGMRELERTIRRLGQLPQKCVTKAARKGANVALKAARRNSPVDTGTLKRGIVLKGERSPKRGKKVYDVTIDSRLTHAFQKQTKSGLRRRLNGRRVTLVSGGYYYPASQEYGFIARNGRYVPGFHYLKKSIDDNDTEIKTTTVQVLASEIDKLR